MLASNDPRHGTATGYRRHKCRCDRCRAAHNETTAAERKRNGSAPSHKAFAYATVRAATWLREVHPDVWEAFYAEGVERYGIGKRGLRRVSPNDGAK